MSQADEVVRQLSARVNSSVLISSAINQFFLDRDCFSLVSALMAAGSLVDTDVWPTIEALLDDLEGVEEVASENPRKYARYSLWAGFLAGLFVYQQVVFPGLESQVEVTRGRVKHLTGQQAKSAAGAQALRKRTRSTEKVVQQIANRIMFEFASDHYRKTGKVPGKRPSIHRLSELVGDHLEKEDARETPQEEWTIRLKPGSVEKHYLTRVSCNRSWTLICRAVQAGKSCSDLGL